MDEHLALYEDEIVYCLMKYGEMSRDDSQHLLSASRILEPWTSPHRENILHELPYYWAMHLIHADHNADWYLDEKLWPVPENYLDHLRGRENAAA